MHGLNKDQVIQKSASWVVDWVFGVFIYFKSLEIFEKIGDERI